MASSSVTASPKPVPSDRKKLKIQELREALASKGMETFILKSDRLDSKAVVSAGNSVDGEGLSHEQVSEQEKKVVQETDAGQLKEATSPGGASMTSISVPKAATGTETKGTRSSSNEGEQHEANESNHGGTTTATSLTDFEKKQRRAERFGVNLQVSELEKRRLRAARFGTQSNGKGAGDKTESEKRQARAARFGIVDDEVKKKARLERFELEAKQDNSTESKKRKARAARFGVGPNENRLEVKKKLKDEAAGTLPSA